MKYLSLIIRLAIIFIWVYILIGETDKILKSLIWTEFILIWVFISMLSVFWTKSIACPLVKCEWESCKK